MRAAPAQYDIFTAEDAEDAEPHPDFMGRAIHPISAFLGVLGG